LPSDPVTPPVPKTKLTIQARPPITRDEGKTYEPDSAVLKEGSLNYGDSFASVQIDVIVNENGDYVAVPRDAVIKNGYVDKTGDYEITYLPSDPVTPPVPKVKITITANEPITKDEGKTYEPNDAVLTEGSLNAGDVLASVQIEVKQNADGTYVAVPSGAVIKNGYVDKTTDYAITYLPSKPVTPPVQKIKISITAKEPVTKDGGKTYEPDSALLTEGSLNPGDSLASVQIDVTRQEDGTYIAVPRDAVIKNGYVDKTADYEITYIPSPPVTPPQPKTKITITAKEPITRDGGRTYEPDTALLTEGSLNSGDRFVSIKIDVEKNADGDYIAIPRDALIQNGDVNTTDNYEITYVQSKPVKPLKIEITVRSKDRTAEYSGKLITANEYVLVSGALDPGDTMEVTYTGGSTNVTAVPIPSTISSVVIKDAMGNDVTASKYAVTLDNENAGKVTVTRHPITVTAISGTVETDGTKVIYAKDCKTKDGSFNHGHKVEGLLEGHELRGDFVKGYGSETFTTSIDLNVLRVLDTVNNLDVTANYQVNTVNGLMTIKVPTHTGVPVVVTVRDQSWTYDGTAHRPNTGGVDISGLLDGDVATVSLRLKQGESIFDAATNAGTYTIIPEVTIKTKDGAPVASNKYNINIIGASGTLTVKKLDITLEAVSDSKSYDGKPLVNDKVKAPALPAGQKYQSVKLNVYDSRGNLIRNGVKDVGTYTKKIAEVRIVDINGTDVTDNYNITKIDGKLTILSSSMNNSTSPKTGEESMTGFVIAIIVSALLLVGIAVVFLVTSKKKPAKPDPDPDYDGFEPIDPDPGWQSPSAPNQNWDSPGEQIWNDGQQQSWDAAPGQNWDAAPGQNWDAAPGQNWNAAPDQSWDAAPDSNTRTDFDLSWMDKDTSPLGNAEDIAKDANPDWLDDPTTKWDDPPKHIPKH
ncbi:MAG: LPXTG cell wall anchor domain-containing protein, partial [Oscillospiraceae bacterium]|nr:LPXTG cell wall anchor domain-containing protein [Oscillospiraceae bacterium]